MLSDAQWSELEPLVEACRPKAKTPQQDLQRTLSAILWRHQNGAKRRAVPEELGPWWRAARIFIRWSRAGVWERLLSLVQERGVQLGLVFLDGTNVRAHPQKAAGPAKKGGSGAERDHREALGRSRGGYGYEACVIADGQGRAIAFQLAPGQAHELPHAVTLLDQLLGVPKWVVGDRGYTSRAFQEHIWDMGARPAIPPQRHEAPVACPDCNYNNRNQVERLWARLKEWRAIATRYEKTAASFMGVLSLAATLDWLKR
ncbi:IS5 family transposase [Methylobacterium sp. WL6]|uniref:IS5 family transposase n=1 Tax=Methylobacterium sp. WL6 TaxID=2603901 RepID=UPI0011CABCDC|nr:IS5 family transposase [Methylobacterium sp. WL6]TXN70490.1 IS5 family transposase [Methylobacterium sp. WL6]